MSDDLLLEIGTEEIPAGFLARALEEIPVIAQRLLADARLSCEHASAVGTPRRLALVVRGLADRQRDVRERVVGPPASAGFDKDGNPTRAAVGFAQKNGVAVESLERAEVEGKKGLYVVCTRQEIGKPAVEVLPALLDELIRGITWPKSMRWGHNEDGFVRPVHWIVALLGDRVVPLRAVSWDVAAGAASRGHRFLAPCAVPLASAAGYAEALRAAFVVVDPEVRRTMIQAELARIEAETALRVRPDAALLAEVTNLVEYPVAVDGVFDAAYLEVPEEVIVTAMRSHQRYFAMEDAAGKLANRFVTIAGTITRDAGAVRRGNERVLCARLADARFFFREDQKHGLASFGQRLHQVVFQAKLGTVGAKVLRIEQASIAIAQRVSGTGAHAIDEREVLRAAELCKADLTTGIVGEFPELQGVMGSHYARLAGEAEPVWRAIASHYLPRGAGDGAPADEIGAIVGIADRMDTLLGCFAVGLEPSGSADPFGLRRAALGVLAILLDRGPGGPRHRVGSRWPVSIDALIDLAAGALEGSATVAATDRGEVREFLRGRLRGVLVDDGLAALDVEAALGAGFDDVCDARLRARDLAVLPPAAREVFKRIANILDDAHGKGEPISGEVKPALFVAPDNAEHRLWRAHQAVRDGVAQCLAEQRYRQLFELLVQLQPAVAAFFDRGGVMVMDPVAALRENRLSLLAAVLAPFAKVADLRQLAVQP
mgnify:CR=1 FL=1